MKTLQVSVSSLKARLSEYLRLVRKGTQLIVVDHRHPVARVAPLEEKEIDFDSTKPTEQTALRGFFPSRKVRRSFSSLDILLEDRKKR